METCIDVHTLYHLCSVSAGSPKERRGYSVDVIEIHRSHQGMQNDGMASMEGTMGDAMESVQEAKLTEGYESKVIKICKDAGIDCSFKDGKLYLDKEDMAKAKKVLKDDDDILELPEMVAENAELDRLKQLIGIDTIREMKQ